MTKIDELMRLFDEAAKANFYQGLHHRVVDDAPEEKREAFRKALEAALKSPALEDIEQYRMQMAGINTAALGYWKEGDAVHPDYDTRALHDVAKLFAKYDKLYKAALKPGEAVASIYITPDGQREVDDWRVELPAGRNLLYTAPQPRREPEQSEPIGWARNQTIDDDNGCPIGSDEPEIHWGKEKPDECGWWPLFAAPPRREPLSDEAIRSVIAAYKKANKLLGVNHRHVARAIEAAYGIGGKE